MPDRSGGVDSPTLTGSNVLVGGKVLIMMDGYVVGFANSAQCSDSYNLVPVHVIGQLQAVEMVPTTASHSITLSTMVMRNDSLVRHQLEPVSGGSYGYLSDGKNIGLIKGNEKTVGASDTQLAKSDSQAGGGQLTALDGKAFNIAITDGKTGQAIVEYIKCYFAQGSFTIAANQVIGHSVTFLALDKRGQWDAGGDSSLGTQKLQAYPRSS